MRPFAPTLAGRLAGVHQLLLVLGVAADATSTSPTPTATNASPPWGTPTWEPLGCFVNDNSGAPVLPDRITPDDGNRSITGARCQDLCFENDWQVRFAGVEGGDSCWCSGEASEPQADDASDCNVPCSGDDTQLCGGDGRLFVYIAVYENFWTQVIEGPEETGGAGSMSETDATAATASAGTPTETELMSPGGNSATSDDNAPSSTGDAEGKAGQGSLSVFHIVLTWAAGAFWVLWV